MQMGCVELPLSNGLAVRETSPRGEEEGGEEGGEEAGEEEAGEEDGALVEGGAEAAVGCTKEEKNTSKLAGIDIIITLL